jgi:hypothetical protein
MAIRWPTYDIAKNKVLSQNLLLDTVPNDLDAGRQHATDRIHNSSSGIVCTELVSDVVCGFCRVLDDRFTLPSIEGGLNDDHDEDYDR